MANEQHKLEIKQLKRIEKFPNATSSFEADPGGGYGNLMTISRCFGIIVVAYGSELLFLETKRLLQGETPSLASLATQGYSLPSSVIWLQCNADGSLLAVCLNNNDSPLALVYNMKTIVEGTLQPICQLPLSDESGDRLLSLKWNPGETECLLSLCKNAGLRLYKIAQAGSVTLLGRVPGSSSVLCADWSPKGKQFAVGLKDGSIVQYKMNCQVYRTFRRPLNPMLVSAVDVAWLLPREFFVLYSTESDAKSCISVLATSSKERPAEMKFLEFNECPFLPPTNDGVRRCFLSFISTIPLLLCSASTTQVLQAFVRDQSDTWHLCRTVQLDVKQLSSLKTSGNRDPLLGLVLNPLGEVNMQPTVMLFSIDAAVVWLQLAYSIDKLGSQPATSLSNVVPKAAEPVVGQPQPATTETIKGSVPAPQALIPTTTTDVVVKEEERSAPEMLQELVQSYEKEFAKVRDHLMTGVAENPFTDTVSVSLSCLTKEAAELSDYMKAITTEIGKLKSVTMKQFSTAQSLRGYLNVRNRAKLSQNLASMPSTSEAMENIRKNFAVIVEKLSSIEKWLDENEHCFDASPETAPRNAIKSSVMSMMDRTVDNLERLTVQAERKVTMLGDSRKAVASSVDERSPGEIIDELSLSMNKLNARLNDVSEKSDIPKEDHPLTHGKMSFEEQLLIARFLKDTKLQRRNVPADLLDEVDLKAGEVKDVSRPSETNPIAEIELQDKDASMNSSRFSEKESGQANNAELESSYMSSLVPPVDVTGELLKCTESLLQDELLNLKTLETNYNFGGQAAETSAVAGSATSKDIGAPKAPMTNASMVAVSRRTEPLDKATISTGATGAATRPNFSNIPFTEKGRQQTDSTSSRYVWTREQNGAAQPPVPTMAKGREPSFTLATNTGTVPSVFPTVKKEQAFPPILPQQNKVTSGQKSSSQPKFPVAVTASTGGAILQQKAEKPKAVPTVAISSTSVAVESKEPISASFTVTTTTPAAVTAVVGASGGSIFSGLNTQDKQPHVTATGGSLFSSAGSAVAKAAPPGIDAGQASLGIKEAPKEGALPAAPVEAKEGKPITFSFGTSAVQAALAKKTDENEAEMDASDIAPSTDTTTKAPAAADMPSFSFKLEDHQISQAPTGGGFFSGLGAKPSAEAASKNVFAAGMSLGPPAPGATKGLFGAPGVNPFAGSFRPSTSSSSPFGGGGSLFGSVTNQPTAFGMSAATPALQTSTSPGGFGSQPTFGGSAFGAQPVFGGGSLFGSPATFGQSAPSGGFSAFAKSDVPSFGALAGGSKASPPSFGSPSSGGQTAGNASSSFTQWRG